VSNGHVHARRERVFTCTAIRPPLNQSTLARPWQWGQIRSEEHLTAYLLASPRVAVMADHPTGLRLSSVKHTLSHDFRPELSSF
jgi:hypothetical protein